MGALSLTLSGHAFHSDVLRGAGALAFFAALGISTPALLCAAFVMQITLAGIWISAGLGGMLDALPALIGGFVGWLFARTLRRGRRPLIARAICAIDGPAQLSDANVVVYARRLTAIWAAWQLTLALCAALLALHAQGKFSAGLRLPTPSAFGLIVMPLAVALLFLGEFFLRPRLLPRAPRHHLIEFVRALVHHWPALLVDRTVAVELENRDAARSS